MLALCVQERQPRGWALHGAGRLENALPVHRVLEAPTRSAQPTKRIGWCLPGERTSQCTRPLTREACRALVINRSLYPVRDRTYSSGAGYR